MLKIFGYTRISVDLQEDSQENTSIENQKRIICDYVRKEFPDAQLQIFEDRDRSGYTFSQRENYNSMRDALMNGESRILVVKDFSRFSRRNSLGLLELETLRDAGIRIISIGDGIDYPTRDDWILIQFKFLLNEMPVTDTSKKIKQMIDNRQKSGRWICAVPYGYRITNTQAMTYEIDPPAAEVVREIFRLYNNGWGYKKIANHLTEQGVPTPRANEIAQKEAEGKTTKIKAKSAWSIPTVQGIIQNDFYIGTLRQHKYTRKGINGKDERVDVNDNIVIQKAHTPIIDDKTFAYAGEQLELRTRSNYRGERKYATDYSGFMVCGDCGAPMFSMSRSDMAPAYTCGTYHRRGLKGCTSHHIRVDTLDMCLRQYILLVRNNCKSMLTELQSMIDDQPKREEELGKAVDSLSKQMEDAREKLKALLKERTFVSAGISGSRMREELYDELIEEAEKRVADLEKQFEETNRMRNSMLETNRKAKTVIGVFEDVLAKEKLDKRDIGLIVNRIIVYEDHLEIKLKSDVDALLSLEENNVTDTVTAEGSPVNFELGSKDNISVIQKSEKHSDKVFTANIVSDGDPLEIYTAADGEVIFKKYSPIGELSSVTSQYAEVLNRSASLPVILTDRDTVIASAGISRREVLDRRVGAPLEDLMERRENYFFSGGEVVKPIEGLDKGASIICPIVGGGDVLGSVIFLSDEKGSVPSETESKLAQVAASFLGKQMEE